MKNRRNTDEVAVVKRSARKKARRNIQNLVNIKNVPVLMMRMIVKIRILMLEKILMMILIVVIHPTMFPSGRKSLNAVKNQRKAKSTNISTENIKAMMTMILMMFHLMVIKVKAEWTALCVERTMNQANIVEQSANINIIVRKRVRKGNIVAIVVVTVVMIQIRMPLHQLIVIPVLIEIFVKK